MQPYAGKGDLGNTVSDDALIHNKENLDKNSNFPENVANKWSHRMMESWKNDRSLFTEFDRKVVATCIGSLLKFRKLADNRVTCDFERLFHIRYGPENF